MSLFLFFCLECDLYYEPIGCFNDDLLSPRPLPDYVISERDHTSLVFNGIDIDWKHWNSYMPKMICRCAKAAQVKGDTYFGVQFHGMFCLFYTTFMDWRTKSGAANQIL